MSDFSASFKRAREARGISLDEVAKATRISTRFLQAIENEEFELLPGGVFNRGFIRAFASEVGLDPENAVAEYEHLAERGEPEPFVRVSLKDRNKGGRRLYVGIAVALVALIILFYAFTQESTNPRVAVDETPVPFTSSVPEPTPAAAEQSPEGTQAALIIEMRVREPTWIALFADGKELVPGETLQPGTTHRYTAQASIQVTIGNAGGLTVKVNSYELPTLGRSGQVRSLTITPESVKSLIGG